ncbi:MAG TPA: CHAD domain-containing protein [Gammaproteobacteria bacterium]|nr:CHAD domain-containing protein [Gammaproteobacteria bacterium]
MSHLSTKKGAIGGVQKAIVGKCNEALESLSGRTVSPEDIHTARKALKKARAWLRLLRTGTGQQAFREQNVALRDAARPLSEGRDAQVLIETLHKLLKRYHEPAPGRRFGRFERALQKDRRATQHRLTSSRAGITTTRRLLRRSKGTLARLPIKGQDWEVIGAGFEKVYTRGHKNLRAAHDGAAPESLHEWRKDAKNLWHELQMLEPLWPGVIEEWADQAHRLTDYLGDDHDLWVLRETCKRKSDDFANPADLDALLALIDRRRGQLQDKARLLGARLYEPKPRRFRARIGKYWRLWDQAGRPDA